MPGFGFFLQLFAIEKWGSGGPWDRGNWYGPKYVLRSPCRVKESRVLTFSRLGRGETCCLDATGCLWTDDIKCHVCGQLF